MNIHWKSLLVIIIIIEWFIRVGMLFIVPRNRRPSSATAWLMLIMVEPIVGSLIFATFGSPKLPKYRRALQKKFDSKAEKDISKRAQYYKDKIIKSEKLSPSELKFEALNRSMGGLPIFEGNEVLFIDDYQKSLQSLINDIDNASRRVFFEYFILAYDQTSLPVLEALRRARSRGVEVYVLFDYLACMRYRRYRKLKKFLNKSDIKWSSMLPLRLLPGKYFTRPDLRNHRKIVVIDDCIGYTGSQNIITKNYHRKDDLYYEELVARVNGPVAWQLAKVFRADWYTETREYLADMAQLPAKSGGVAAQLLPSGPSYKQSGNLKLYTALMHGAHKKIVIVTPYFVPDESLMNALTSAAQRGVEVIMINSEVIDKLLVGHAQRSYYEELLSAGVQIYLYEKPVFLHTKHLTIDETIAVVGSSNLDIRSFELDLEVSLVLYSRESVTSLRKIEKRYMKNSQLVTINDWNKRSLRLRLLDNLARLTAAFQ